MEVPPAHVGAAAQDFALAVWLKGNPRKRLGQGNLVLLLDADATGRAARTERIKRARGRVRCHDSTTGRENDGRPRDGRQVIMELTKLDRVQRIYDGNGAFDMMQERLAGDVTEAHAEPVHGVRKLRVPLDDQGIETLGPDGRLIEVSDEVAILPVFHFDHSLEGTDFGPAEWQREQRHAPSRLRDLWLLNCLNTM